MAKAYIWYNLRSDGHQCVRWLSMANGSSRYVKGIDFMIFDEFPERLAYQMIANIYQKDNTRLANRSSHSELSSVTPGTTHNCS